MHWLLCRTGETTEIGGFSIALQWHSGSPLTEISLAVGVCQLRIALFLCLSHWADAICRGKKEINWNKIHRVNGHHIRSHPPSTYVHFFFIRRFLLLLIFQAANGTDSAAVTLCSLQSAVLTLSVSFVHAACGRAQKRVGTWIHGVCVLAVFVYAWDEFAVEQITMYLESLCAHKWLHCCRCRRCYCSCRWCCVHKQNDRINFVCYLRLVPRHAAQHSGVWAALRSPLCVEKSKKKIFVVYSLGIIQSVVACYWRRRRRCCRRRRRRRFFLPYNFYCDIERRQRPNRESVTLWCLPVEQRSPNRG